jgi:hypothetical protein
VNAAWRAEGLGVLAWALKWYELPPYDRPVPPDDTVFEGGRLTVDLLFRCLHDETVPAPWESAELRPYEEIHQYVTHATLVHWRMVTFRMHPEQTQDLLFDPRRMDFLGYLKSHPSFKENWLDGLRFIDGDLALGDSPIGDAPEEFVSDCMSVALERQIAAYWLQGDNEVYSQVSPDTILTAC